jgi:hypothetical protein
MKLDTLKM